jgi:putative phosphoribosyl transferase
VDRADRREGRRELERRERSYRAGRAHPDIAGKIVILVDDGLATGSTMLAAEQNSRVALWAHNSSACTGVLSHH